VDFGAVSGGEQEVKLYKSARQPDGTFREEDLVGGATITVPAASATNVGVVVSERNDSGLAGTFQFDFTAATGVSTTDNVVLATHSFDRAADADRAAGLFFAGGDPSASLDFDAVTAGSEGNNISVELVHPGAENQAPQVSVEGNKVTVSLGTDADGNITTTAGDIEGAGGLIDSHPVASTLVTATATGAGTGVVEARSETYLTGGLDAEQGVNIDTDTDGFDHMAFSGVEVGTNTDANGRLYAEVLDSDSDGDPDTINVYKHADKSADNLVAQYDGNTTTGGDLTTDGTVLLDEMNDSGLRIALVVDRSELNAGNATWQFQTGLRLSATEYGRENYVRLQALEGKMWDYYDPSNVDRADAGGYVNVDATFGSAYAESRGTGAQITVNGQTVFTDGLTAELTTPDLNGHVAFHDGEIGATTLAQVGYTRAYSTTAVGQMMRATNMAVNAGVNAREDMTNFSGGMQLQLGEGSGDQERTVYGIQSMAVANLGKVQLEGDWYDSGEITTKTLSMSDLLGGGFASLATDPVKALAVVDQAIEDVASLRARLGAAQKNLLQTNRNSLDVAIENVTSTESDIRDANMAKESTAFTKNQILVQAGTAMLAQANTVQQNVLQLLG
jgi:flagellin-like hook-associated protein FlgL